MRSSSQIRQSFLDFFKDKGHEIVPSAPVVLPTDPTLLFTNAGMNPFKDIFLGARKSTSKRVANTQKCIRVSGKHNDLEEVGVDTYHHTFFEMLGNWSFGDYYKREAIAWAWELLTDVWGLPKNRLWATVYYSDDEAETLWKEVTDVEPDHVLRFGNKDNFWEMGDTGPCGPCSEVHVDLTLDGSGGKLVNAGHPEVIELWNLVFIQHNRRSDGTLEDLKDKHVDTGMGFERIVAVLQGRKSNYDTDLFMPLIDVLKEMTDLEYQGESAIAMRVIVDHIRALSFAIADGVLPSNEGRGYVLRRLLRRSVRYGRKIGLNKSFMSDLFPLLEKSMSDLFPELTQQRETIIRTLKAEEESFASTLDRGIHLFDEVIQNLKEHKAKVFPGDRAFTLYDTYGFPLDLTVLMAAEKEMHVDETQFNTRMEKQKERARGARKKEMIKQDAERISDLIKQGVQSNFMGYQSLQAETKIVSMLVAGKEFDKISENQEASMILQDTPFYSESGGQLGDKGILHGSQGEFEVWDTQRLVQGIVLHIGRVVQGDLNKRDTISACVDGDRRINLARHHTATHLLNAALRELINHTIKQAGSLVTPDRLRFDFTHYEPIPEDKIRMIEERVNNWVMQDNIVSTSEMLFKDVSGSGITAIFNEKYGDVVRVVDIGGYSRELCGGTHVQQTGELGSFQIISESSVASGVRRIEAVCGLAAYQWNQEQNNILQQITQRFSVRPDELVQRIDSLVDQNKRLEKALKQKSTESAQEDVQKLFDTQQDVNGICVVSGVVQGQSMDGLRKIMDALRQKILSGIVVLGSGTNSKAHFVATVTDDLVKTGFHAGNLIGKVAKIAEGGGGGQPHKAQAGGKNPGKVPEAIQQVPEIIRCSPRDLI
ncbi:MAG: alanine--tRNA ligase [Kiritimatiellae bacterium]|nr:alanine--tRNA ligase [Kiritimatiellia bacterium]